MSTEVDEMQELWNKAFGSTPSGPIPTGAPATPDIEDDIDAAMTKLKARLADASSLQGRTIVVTGKLEGFTRAQVVAAIRAKGGACPNTVTRDTVALVAGSKPGRVKVSAAIHKGIPILTETNLMMMLKGD
jgi:NAD-dependent DNA ligase